MTGKISGKFEVKLDPQAPDAFLGAFQMGRMSIDKQFFGDIEANSKGQMLSVMTETKGSAGYVAIERVEGKLAGRRGTFILQHYGMMIRGVGELTIGVVPDSGTGELAGLSGSMVIDIKNGEHHYQMDYTIDDEAV